MALPRISLAALPALAVTGIVALALAASLAHAQGFPAKPVRLLVPFTAGSETDYLARVVGQRLGDAWGQQVVVENRPGAGGVLATGIAAQAPGDGYTLLMGSMSHAIAPAMHSKLPYNPLRDFAAVSQVAGVPNVLVVAPAGPKSVRELVALAKSKPGQVTFGSAGNGSGMHFTAEQFRIVAGISVLHVAYKGGPESLTDLLGGRIDFVFAPIGLAVPLVKDRKLQALGVSTAARSPALPDVPTVAEAGVAGYEFDTWYGLFAPSATPRAIVRQISGDVAKALALPEVRAQLSSRGAVPRSSTPEEFDAFVRAEIDKMAAIVKAANLRTD
ncbi:MAG: tripartite tricarboxylate transporter substrate binding protein [Betaproteobacteria bacterium]